MIRSWRGKTPKVHHTAFISEHAYVVGDVEIGENSSIWPGTVVRGDTGKIVIGKNTNIQDNCVVHSDGDAWIGDNVTIGHAVVCHGKRVGNYCLIGNHATVNDGVEIEDNCLIGSGALVLENFRAQAGSFVVGAPAQVKSKVTEKHMALVKGAAERYVQRAKLYKIEGLEKD